MRGLPLGREQVPSAESAQRDVEAAELGDTPLTFEKVAIRISQRPLAPDCDSVGEAAPGLGCAAQREQVRARDRAVQEIGTEGHAYPAHTVEESRPEQGSAEAGTLDEASTLLERREISRGRLEVDQLGENRLALEREQELAAERRQAPVDPPFAIDSHE